MGKIFKPPSLRTTNPPPAVAPEDDNAIWQRIAPGLPDPAVTPDAALAAWFDDTGRGLPWVDKARARQYAASCISHGIPFTRDNGTQGLPREWIAWAEAL